MPKGGARSRSGPAPDPNALTVVDGEWVTLPAVGRSGPAPVWPMPSVTDRESEVWSALWSKPQALEWERLGQEHYVALYVRRLVEAEVAGSAVNLSTLVRQMSDELGLTAAGMARNRWKVERVDDKSSDRSARQSTKDRFRVVTGGKG